VNGDVLVLGTMAAVAALGFARRGSRTVWPFVSVEIQHAPEGLIEGVEQSLAVFTKLVPGAKRRLREVEFEVGKPTRYTAPGGWFLQDEPGRIRLAPYLGSVPLVTHQAFHALDVPRQGYPWRSLVPQSPSRRLAERAMALATERLEAYTDELLEKRLHALPPKLRRCLLDKGRMPLLEALDRLWEEEGLHGDSGRVVLAIQLARHPFGGVSKAALGKELTEEERPAVDAILTLAMLLPTGLPFRLLDASQQQRNAYVTSVDPDHLRFEIRTYLFQLNEVFARLMDQALREAAWREGLAFPFAVRRPDDLPSESFAQIEPQVWNLLGTLGWLK